MKTGCWNFCASTLPNPGKITAMEEMEIERLEEYQIGAEKTKAIYRLLGSSFPDYPAERIYFRQVPNFRYLAWNRSDLVGHLGVDFRIMNNDGQRIRTFGVVDLCVGQPFRHRGVAARLLDTLECEGRAHGIDFVVLWAQDRDFYEKRGFVSVENPCRWLLIQQDHSYGLVHRKVAEGLMILRLGNKNWRPGTLDFLGHIF